MVAITLLIVHLADGGEEDPHDRGGDRGVIREKQRRESHHLAY